MTVVFRSARMQVGWMLLVASPMVGCQASQRQETQSVRSPSTDYQPPSSTMSDGWVVGADNTAPSDRLEEGLRIGTTVELAPGWTLTKDGLSYNPKQRIGGAVCVEEVAMQR
jgi:hypothetical protein